MLTRVRPHKPTQTDLFGAVACRPAEPFLKWAGGKRQLLPELLSRVPRSFNDYIEPFLGSGALFFALEPKAAKLSDANCELIRTYVALRDRPQDVMVHLRRHRNDRDYFNEIRAQDPTTLGEDARAARLIYLNRTCYNGLYRVNRRGHFNTPFGSYKNPTICNDAVLLAASRALRGVALTCSDYSAAVGAAKKGDFVYLDPPYVPVSVYSDFKRYHSEPFGIDQHLQLKATFAALSARGCYVMLSNSHTPLTLELYGEWNLHQVSARRLINKNPTGRAAIPELLVTSY
jgi:DNA adenine methylase